MDGICGRAMKPWRVGSRACVCVVGGKWKPPLVRPLPDKPIHTLDWRNSAMVMSAASSASSSKGSSVCVYMCVCGYGWSGILGRHGTVLVEAD